ncbi:hypothetical protein [Nonomuraea sp. NPDC046570]|uniref:hypothetical protein n=1 Tax=Nonomuraea sp. NPDC046570 TaxID=3155255 RepID=UPI003402BF0B
MRAVARWLLPVLLALGIYGMHTLGHLAPHNSPAVHTQSHERPLGGDMPGLDPSSVCLAVLTSLLVMLLVAVKARVRRASRAPGGGPAVWLCVARPPPRRTAVRLALVSVLRM